jgi:outer membrane protein
MKFIISILAFTIAFQSFAQDEKLTKEKCRELAVSYNQDVKSSIAEVEASGYDAEAINKDNLPKIDLNSNYRYLSNGISMDGYNTLEHIYNVNVSIFQNIYSGGQVKTSYDLARTKQVISSEQKRFTASEVVLETDKLYWDVVGNGEYLNLSHRYRDIVDQLVITVLDKVEEEVLSRTEYLQAKVSLNDAELKVIQSENNLKLAEMALNRVIGIEITTDITADDSVTVDFNSIDDIDYVQTALTTRPEIKINENLVTASDLNIGLTRSPYLPTIGVGAFARYGTPGLNLSPDPNFNFQAFGYLNMPLVYFGKKGKQVEASRVRSQIASLQLDKTQDLITLEVSQARYALEESVKKVNLTENSVLQADENLDLVSDRYNEGLSPIIDVLNAQIFWESAYKDFVNAKIGFQVSYSIYQKALGLNYIEIPE